jgi:hypothetical protein
MYLIVSPHLRLLSALFPSGIPIKILYALLVSLMALQGDGLLIVYVMLMSVHILKMLEKIKKNF